MSLSPAKKMRTQLAPIGDYQQDITIRNQNTVEKKNRITIRQVLSTQQKMDRRDAVTMAKSLASKNNQFFHDKLKAKM